MANSIIHAWHWNQLWFPKHEFVYTVPDYLSLKSCYNKHFCFCLRVLLTWMFSMGSKSCDGLSSQTRNIFRYTFHILPLCMLESHKQLFMVKAPAVMKSKLGWLYMENGRFHMRDFDMKSRSGIAQKMLITWSKVCNWPRKTFWVNIIYSLYQVHEIIYTLKELTCVKTLYRNNRQP